MKTSLKTTLLAGLFAVAVVAHAQPPMGAGHCDPMMGAPEQGMHQRGMGRMDPAKMQAMHDKHLKALKSQLKLLPAQEGAWTNFIDALKPPANKQSLHPDAVEMSKLTTPERIEKMKSLHAQHMKDMTAQMDQRGEATKVFYATLTPEQQKVFDANAIPKHGKPHGSTPSGKP